MRFNSPLAGSKVYDGIKWFRSYRQIWALILDGLSKINVVNDISNSGETHRGSVAKKAEHRSDEQQGQHHQQEIASTGSSLLARSASLRALVRRLSGGGGGSGSSSGGSAAGNSGSATVSGSPIGPGARCSLSRRASRELSPSGSCSPSATPSVVVCSGIQHQYGEADEVRSATQPVGSASSTASIQVVPPEPGSQDWRRLVGSIRRKVRRKTPQSSASSISEQAEQSTLGDQTLASSSQQKHHDDFLKATMRIFLVVSPPMGRVQVIRRLDPYLFSHDWYNWLKWTEGLR
ncbi:hypothetical protein QAD02_023828 [Eretmocerus hayati]|uniref:Uncharacterized protein n=1 Tax=Eretmocerus hayati TaxID=131215 RepID=A0ACC2PYJ9_9HYME|nr:hypothetical protein QAD02_023828 [Eretmocerus hayati]